MQNNNSQLETATKLLNDVAEKSKPMSFEEMNKQAVEKQRIRESITQQDINNYLQYKQGKKLEAEQNEKGFFTGLAESVDEKLIPYVGNLIEGRENQKTVDAILKAKNHPEQLTKEEITEFDKYITKINKEGLAGSGNILYILGRNALPTLKYGFEYGLNTTAGTLVAGSGAPLVSALEPTRLYKHYQEKQLEGLIKITDKGKMFFSDLEKKPFLTTMYKAYAQSLASDISEKLGGLITNNALVRNVIGKTTGIKKKVLEVLLGVSEKTGTSIGDLFNGFIGEHIEEYIEKPLTQILGANNNEYNLDNLAQSLEMPSWDEFLLTSGMIAIQGFTGLGMQKMVGKMQARKVKPEDIETYIKTRKQEDVERDLKRLSEAEQEQFNIKKEQYKQDLRNITNYTEEQINENMNLYDKVFSYGYMNFNDNDLSVNEWIEQYGFKILDNVKNSDVLNQTAYHGTPYDFDKFTLDHIGAGEGAQAHGWGLYFALDKKTAEGYKNKLKNETNKGKLYEVEIPNNNVMLFEYKSIKQQSKTVKENLKNLLNFSKEISNDFYNNHKHIFSDTTYLGEDFYNDLTKELKSNKKASELLNEYDIQGIRYNGRTDGECAVVFDDNAIYILDKLNQSQNKKILGQYDVRERIISLSKESNPTTFQHEMMHWWKSTISTFAEQGNKQAQADLNILNKYVKADSNNWNREQEEIFARSWEQYLRKGIAPTKELQTVFDKIRDWFIEIYKSAKDIMVNGKPIKLDTNIINYFDNLLSLEPNKNIELDYNIKYDRLQNEVDKAREILYQEEPEFTEEEINAILRERFKEQLTPLEELQFKIEQENKKTVKQKVDNIFNTYQYDKKEFSEITKRIKSKIDNINKMLKSTKSKDLKIADIDDLEFTLNDLMEIKKIANQRLPKKPQTLTQWIKSVGGVFDEGGDVSGLDIKGLTRKSRYKKYGTRFGDYVDLSLDSVRETARERGFNLAEDSSVADFINLIHEDASGNYQYRASDINKVNDYQERKQQKDEAQELLDKLDVDLDSIIDLYKKAKENNFELLNKDKIKLIQEESKKAQEEVKYVLKEIQNKEKTVKRELETKIKQEKQSIKNVKAKVIDMINNSDLENNDKAKFLNTIKNINSDLDFENNKDFILQRIKAYEMAEINRVLKKEINKELEGTKDLKQGNKKIGRYEYQDNLLFNDLRQYNKNTKIQNEIALANLLNDTPQNERHSTLFNIKERFLNYKINGVNNSVEFSKQVLKDIVDFKSIALENKQEIDNIKFNNKTIELREINEAIENNKANKNSLKTKITSGYRTTFTNLYSLINSITNKSIADKYNIELAESKKATALYLRVKELKTDLMNALEIKKEKDLFKYLNDSRSQKFVLTDLNNSKQDINKMHILNMYAEMKNELKSKQYLNNYGASQLNDLFLNLTEDDKKVADVFVKLFNNDRNYDIINKYYIEHFNKDLKRVEGVYIPSKSEYFKETDFFDTFNIDASNSFSSLKERRQSENIKPVPQDLYNNYINHINQIEYIDKVAPLFKEMEANFINNNKIKNDITYKFGNDVFNSLKSQLQAVSFITNNQYQNTFDNILNKGITNWIIAKISSPVVFLKQLSGVVNYAENVDSIQWTKNFIAGISNPKKTIEYMKKNFPSIEVRYKNGFNETLNRANEFTQIGTIKKNINEFSTFLTRMGDAGSVIFGGYAQVQTDLQNGVSQQQAFDNFETQTIRSQQSGFASSLSTIQQSKNVFARLTLSFANQPLQYFRKITDSIIMYQNNDITAKQLAKTIMLYTAINGIFYSLLSEWGHDLFSINEDDEEDTAKQLLAQVLKSPFEGLPFISDVVSYSINSSLGLKNYDLFKTVMLDDVAREIKRMSKEDITTTDFLNFMATVLEVGTGAPVKNINKVQRVITKKDLLK